MKHAPTPSITGPIAVLSDLDGTLVDTERTWLESVRRTIESFGHVADAELVASLEGATLEQAGHRLVDVYGLALPPAEVAAVLEDLSLQCLAGNIHWRPGAEQALRAFQVAGIQLALVTSSSRRWFDSVAREVDLSMVDTIVTADDVLLTKPHAAPYLLAAERLRVPPSSCVVFEDSRVGLQAAKAAGCIGMLVRADDAPWAKQSDIVLPSLTGVDAHWLHAAVSALHGS